MSRQDRVQPYFLETILLEWSPLLPEDEMLRESILQATISDALRNLHTIDDSVCIEDTLFEAFQRVLREKRDVIVASTKDKSDVVERLKSADDLLRTVRPQATAGARARAS
jgi:hypothetical protein